MKTFREQLIDALDSKKWDKDMYLPVYDKCKERKMLYSDEYKIAMDLNEVGFVIVYYEPKFIQGRFKGNTVYFQSIN